VTSATSSPLRAAFSAEKPVFLAFAAYIGLALLISFVSGHFFNPFAFALEFGLAIITLLGLWLVFASAVAALRTKVDRPLAALAAQLRARLTPELWVGASMILLLLIFIQCFLAIKHLLPRYFDFAWDVPLADFDRWLHGGTDPWQLLQPLLGSAGITRALELVYSALWLLAVLLFPALVILLVKSRTIRHQYFYTYVASWALLGNLMAGLMLSGGPAYYDIFVGDAERFAGLVDFLRAQQNHALSAMGFRDVLLKIHETGTMSEFGGISAMPSMHIAMATLFACVARAINRPLFIFAALFLIVMQMASVHLGWHYAVDGYASIVLTVLIWHVCGRLARRSASL
jgi:hypothetical protein